MAGGIGLPVRMGWEMPNSRGKMGFQKQPANPWAAESQDPRSVPRRPELGARGTPWPLEVEVTVFPLQTRSKVEGREAGDHVGLL